MEGRGGHQQPPWKVGVTLDPKAWGMAAGGSWHLEPGTWHLEPGNWELGPQCWVHGFPRELEQTELSGRCRQCGWLTAGAATLLGGCHAYNGSTG